MQWFIKEQVEEVASMSDLLRVVERVAREPAVRRGVPRPRAGVGRAADATAPAAAGGAL